MIRPLEPPPPAAAAISRATYNTTHGDEGREGGATNGGSIRGQPEGVSQPTRRERTQRTSDTICESRSLARVAVVVTLFLVIATHSTEASGVHKGNGRNCRFNWINVQVIDSFSDRPLICYQPAFGRRPRITSGSRKQGVER